MGKDTMLTAQHSTAQHSTANYVLRRRIMGNIDSKLDETHPVYDGLYEYVDFLDESKYIAETYTYSGCYGKFDIIAGQNKPIKFNPLGLYQTGYQKKDLSADLPLSNGITLEIEIYIDENVTTTTVACPIAGGVNNNVGMFMSVRNTGQMNIGYIKANGQVSVAYSTVHSVGYVYGTAGYKHIVLAANETDATVYIEGKAVSKQIFADLPDFSTLQKNAFDIFSINGSWGTVGNYAQCLRVYNRALTESEVENNYLYQSTWRSINKFQKNPYFGLTKR